MNNKDITIVHFEDNPGDARLIQEMINESENIDFNLIQFDNLSSGLNYIANEKVDVILLDLSLRGTTGIDTFLQLYGKNDTYPVIVLSGFADEILAIETVKMGAQDYLVKGQLNSNLLINSIKYAIERKNLEEENKRKIKMEKMMTRIIYNFIGQIDIDIGINDALKVMADTKELGYAFLFQISDKNGKLKETHNWTAEGYDKTSITSAINNSTHVKEWIDKYVTNNFQKEFQEAKLSKFESNNEMLFLNSGKLIVTPVKNRKGLIGIAGFADNRNYGKFSEEDILLLRIVSLVFGNVIEKNNIERKLRESENRYRDLFENANDLIQSVNSEGKFVYVNNTWLKTLEYERKDLEKLTILDIVHKKHHKHCMEIFKRVCAGETFSRIETVFVSRTGRQIIVEGNVNSYLDNNGITRTRGIFRDITDRQNAYKEREKYQQKLAYVENMASIGKLAGGVAHEINNPLTSILTTAELLEEEIESDCRFKEDIAQIIAEAKRIGDTVKSFLGFARTREFVFKSFNLNDLIENALNIVGRSQLKNIVIKKNYDSALKKIIVSRFHIEEVIVNLLINALHSLNNKGHIIITSGQNRKNVFLKIKDSGCGISKDNIDKIFRPYFTTKDKKGTGLGLSLSKMIIEQHGGEISVKSKGRGYGTEFMISFPKVSRGLLDRQFTDCNNKSNKRPVFFNNRR